MKKGLQVAVFYLFLSLTLSAQDNLINALSKNVSENSKQAFAFTPVVNIECTSVKNQGRSGTCWSYSGNSFLESEMIKAGKRPVDIAEIYTARCAYLEKAKNYVRMHGSLNWGDGGELHDVTNMYAKYGALPQEVYTGLTAGAKYNDFSKMQAELKVILDSVVKTEGTIDPKWQADFTAVMDKYLGKVPETFTYNGKTYTPLTFAKEVVGLNAADYVEISSFEMSPYYQKMFFPVPDNWSFDMVYNVKLNDLTDIIDHALKMGYSVGWASDVSEKYFSWKNGVAYVPAKPLDQMDSTELKSMFNGPKPELDITEDIRQQAFDNYETQDDHGMQIVGLSKDQNGKEYYLVKNSWDASNDYKGFIYVTKNFVKYKSTAIMLNKKGLVKNMKKKLKV
jgi:bleomycin hydrolase